MKLNLNKCEWYLYCSFLFFRNCDRKVFTWIRKFSRNNQVIYNVDTNMKTSKTSIVKIILSEHTAIVKPWKTTTLDRVLRHQFDINVQTFFVSELFIYNLAEKTLTVSTKDPTHLYFTDLLSIFDYETTEQNFMKLGR